MYLGNYSQILVSQNDFEQKDIKGSKVASSSHFDANHVADARRLCCNFLISQITFGEAFV